MPHDRGCQRRRAGQPRRNELDLLDSPMSLDRVLSERIWGARGRRLAGCVIPRETTSMSARAY